MLYDAGHLLVTAVVFFLAAVQFSIARDEKPAVAACSHFAAEHMPQTAGTILIAAVYLVLSADGSAEEAVHFPLFTTLN